MGHFVYKLTVIIITIVMLIIIFVEIKEWKLLPGFKIYLLSILTLFLALIFRTLCETLGNRILDYIARFLGGLAVLIFGIALSRGSKQKSDELSIIEKTNGIFEPEVKIRQISKQNEIIE